ncbi:hypothetical protein ACFLYP_03410 [Chloroflexota bacterium]
MERYKYDSSDSPEIIVSEIKGSLRIKGWDSPEFRIDTDEPDTAKVSRHGDRFEVSCTSGCLLRMPYQGSVEIGDVQGELMVKSMEGNVVAEQISGQVYLKATGSTHLNTVNGNLSARNVEGDLSIKNVNGNATVREVEGLVDIETINGNFTFRGISHGMQAFSNSNASLRLESLADGDYHVKAQGNLTCRVAPGTSAEVALHSTSESIRIKTPETKEFYKQKEAFITLGDGDSKIRLEANGRIEFVSYSDSVDIDDEIGFSLDEEMLSLADEITQQVTEQIESQIESVTSQIESMTGNLNLNAATAERTRRRLDAKRRELDRKLVNTKRKAQRKARSAAHRASGHQSRYSRKHRYSDPVSDAERKLILEMVQNNHISVEEAEKLLAALEGELPQPTKPPTPPPPPPPPELDFDEENPEIGEEDVEE